VAADPIWKKKLLEALGYTPKYDIDIKQYGKPSKEALESFGFQEELISKGELGVDHSGFHPGVESGYMGGIVSGGKTVDTTGFRRKIPQEVGALGTYFPGNEASGNWAIGNKNPTQVGWNKPSIKGGAGGGFKRVLKHLGAMESPGPDWSLEAKKSGVTSPWSPTNVAWSPVGGTMLDWKKKRTA